MDPDLRSLVSLEGSPQSLASVHGKLIDLDKGGIGPEIVHQIHNVLGAAGVLTPEVLQSTIRAYLGDHQGCLHEDVVSAMGALDARLVACHGILVEDIPLDVLGQFCADPTVFSDNEHIARIRKVLYAESKFPILSGPPSASRHLKDLPVTKRRRQFVVERETLNSAVREYHALQLKLAQEGRSATSQQKMRVWVQWVQEIARRIVELRQEGSARLPGKGAKTNELLRNISLDPELLGIITCQTVLNLVYLPNFRSKDETKEWDGSVPFVTVVVAVGEAVEMESMLRKQGPPKRSASARASQASMAAMLARRRNGAAGSWDQVAETVPIGAALVSLLLESAHVEVKRSELPREDLADLPAGGGDAVRVKAFSHSTRWEKRKRVGYLALESHARHKMDYQVDIMPLIEPKYQPMVMEPRPWRPSASVGGYLMHQVPFIRTTSQSSTCLRVYSPRDVVRVMDRLGQTPWRINRSILQLMLEAQRRDLAIAEIPPREAPEVPTLPDNISDLAAEEREALLIKRHNAEKRCMELQSEWPTFEFKIQVARNFENAERIYFPHNVDFRGRTYPIPPHLNHISDDICRGLLTFAEAKPLGKEGFYWLKLSLANLLGKNKLSFEERIAFVDESKDWIIEVARDPLATKNIDRWAHADDGPWQALARCRELAHVWTSGEEESFCSSLPIHLDGSCNGLQHYAALGRDEMGARAVNLVPSDRPQDVYSVVLGIVKQKVERDAACFDDDDSKEGNNGRLARRLISLNALQRKVVKQTVMTICYGVTRLGAQRQVQGHLGDLCGEQVGPEELRALATYLSRLVLASIDEVFERAMKIKVWFDSVSRLLNELEVPTSWLSPIGLACVQPYRKKKTVTLVTQQQKVSLNAGDTCRLQKQKQRMGFPPNFIHSLDATHMMMVADGCHQEGLTFAGVHDSFWTHACDAPALNRIIRSAFVQLHQQPILEDLYEDLCVRLGGRQPPELPKQGSLDLSHVLRSLYVFN